MTQLKVIYNKETGVYFASLISDMTDSPAGSKMTHELMFRQLVADKVSVSAEWGGVHLMIKKSPVFYIGGTIFSLLINPQVDDPDLKQFMALNGYQPNPPVSGQVSWRFR